MGENYKLFLYDYLLKAGASELLATYTNIFALLLGLLILVGFLYVISWKVLRIVSVTMARKTKTHFDDFLVANKVPKYVARIVPMLLLLKFIPIIFEDFPYIKELSHKILISTTLLLLLIIIGSLVRSGRDFLKTLARFKDKPIDSYSQVFMIFMWVLGILTLLAIFTNIPIWSFFTALGAASAIFLLIFKDSILGLVASIQVSINDMVRIGDWITYEKHGADGFVTEINLTTVKVQNFDRTITTIPTYYLISESFKNWRGMQTSGGRRIKRSIAICQKSVRFLSKDDIDALRAVHLIENYLDTQSKKIDSHNEQHNINKELALNGRNLTNLGVFRKYVEEYLNNLTVINKTMMLTVRQLQPTPQGIPIEIYAFSSDKRWVNYEHIMADIFDHLLATIPYFGLEIFEYPTVFPTIPNNGQ